MRGIMRRGAMLAALVLGLGSTLQLLPSTVEPAQAAAVAPVPPRPADSLVESYGVGVHLNWLDTPYQDYASMIAAMNELGVRHARDDFHIDAPRQWAVIREAAAHGITFDLITGRPTSPQSAKEYVDTIAAQLPGAVDSLEGSNEWDISRRPAWTTELLTRQAALYQAAKANPATKDLPVLAPALAFVQNFPTLGAVNLMADESNGHFYAGGRPPSAPLIPGIPVLQQFTGPDKPVVITEAGYHNAMNTKSGHLPTPEDVTAAYLPRLLLESFSRGVKRVYSYELLDHFANPDLTDEEAHFGLLRHDLSRKPAFTAMKTVLGLAADPGASFTPAPLDYTIQGGGSDLRQVLVQKSTGEYVLFLWRDVWLWDPATKRRLTVKPTDVRVDLPGTRKVSVYRPTQGSTPVQTSEAAQVTVPLAGEALALEIEPVTVPEPANPTVTTPADPAASSSPPVVPRPTVRAKRGGKLTVKWGQATSSGSPVSSYRVQAPGTSVLVPASKRRAVLTDLPRKQRVKVGLSAQNAAGWGPVRWSKKVRTR